MTEGPGSYGVVYVRSRIFLCGRKEKKDGLMLWVYSVSWVNFGMLEGEWGVESDAREREWRSGQWQLSLAWGKTEAVGVFGG